MFEEYEKKKRKQVSMMRSVMDYGMGILILLVGLFFLFHEKLKMKFASFPPSSMDKFLGGLFLVYGCWRLYRGYKKNYFK
jgi:hypothetical protein